MASSVKTTNSLIMTDSLDEQGERQYARTEPRPASTGPSRRFILLFGGLLVAILVPTFISFGMWQWNKAAAKEARQTLLDTRSHEPAVQLSAAPADAEALRFRQVSVRGVYEPQHQILIDNRVHQERAGYHVVTPLRIEGPAGSEMRVLVNRGWISANGTREMPAVETPTGPVELLATAVLPGTRFFTLAPEPSRAADAGWQMVWQNLDLDRYRKSVSFPLQPVVLQLDPQSSGGGFVRDWPRPDERIERHIGYAWQWFGFAVATVGIWLFFLVRPWFSRK
ncbi:MAG: surfeit locus 1 family protein [Pseudomonadota bacterium]|nr:surfeit locus 1 family protein [Pseudomonadota bacterium]